MCNESYTAEHEAETSQSGRSPAFTTGLSQSAGGVDANLLGLDPLVLVDDLDLLHRLRHGLLEFELTLVQEIPAVFRRRAVRLLGVEPVGLVQLARRVAAREVVLGVARDFSRDQLLVQHRVALGVLDGVPDLRNLVLDVEPRGILAVLGLLEVTFDAGEVDGLDDRLPLLCLGRATELGVLRADWRVLFGEEGGLRAVVGLDEVAVSIAGQVDPLALGFLLSDDLLGLAEAIPAVEALVLELAGLTLVGRCRAVLCTPLLEGSDGVVVPFRLVVVLGPRRAGVVLDPCAVLVEDGLLGLRLCLPLPLAGLLPAVAGAHGAPLVLPVGTGLDLLGHTVLGVLVRLGDLAVFDAVLFPGGLGRVVAAGFQYVLVVERPLVAGRRVPLPAEGVDVLPVAVGVLHLDDAGHLLLVLVLDLVVVDRDLPLEGLDAVLSRDDLLVLVVVREGLAVAGVGARVLVEVVRLLLLALHPALVRPLVVLDMGGDFVGAEVLSQLDPDFFLAVDVATPDFLGFRDGGFAGNGPILHV